MEVLSVKAAPDHLEKLSKCSPLKGLEELIWNAFDADATRIAVSVVPQGLEGVDYVQVQDDGIGFDPITAREAFGQVGGSRKRGQTTTIGGRLMHGKEGRGRYRALGIGNSAHWLSRYQTLDKLIAEIDVSLGVEGLATPIISDPKPVTDPTGTGTGCTVIVRDARIEANALLTDSLPWELATRFANQLLANPDVQLVVNDEILDPTSAIFVRKTYDFTIPAAIGDIKGQVIVCFWNHGKFNDLFFCTERGVAVEKVDMGMKREQSLSYSAYVLSSYFEDGDLNYSALEGLDEGAVKLRDMGRHFVKVAIREVLQDQARTTVEVLRDNQIYPFEGDPKDEVEVAERQVFEIAAQKIYELSPTLNSAKPEEQRVKMLVLRTAIEEGPSARDRIIQKVFQLDPQKQEEFANLLDRVELSNIVGMASQVVGRMDFLAMLHLLVYDPESKKKLRERSQLHKILLKDLWLFGENFNLGRSDSSLKNVLKAHLRILGREEVALDEPVPEDINMDEIPDLMLYRSVPTGQPGHYEHLVVELKRPKVRIGRDEFYQIMDYADAVARHGAFDLEKTKWKFVVVSSEVDPKDYNLMACEARRPRGLLREEESGRYTVWAYTWGSIIQEAQSKPDYLREALRYDVDTNDHAIEYMRKHYSDLIPEHLKSTDGNPAASEA